MQRRGQSVRERDPQSNELFLTVSPPDHPFLSSSSSVSSAHLPPILSILHLADNVSALLDEGWPSLLSLSLSLNRTLSLRSPLQQSTAILRLLTHPDTPGHEDI